MISVNVSDDPRVCKSCCSDVYGPGIRVRGSERVVIIVVDGVRKGIPEGDSYQICPIVAIGVVGVNPLSFDSVAVVVFIDVELDIMGFLRTSSRHRDIHFVPDMGGVVWVISLVSQGYWEFGVQNFNLRDGHW